MISLKNEVSEDDLSEAGIYSETYRQGQRLEHLYGTTLIAALMVSKYLILIQQGDGRCDVFTKTEVWISQSLGMKDAKDQPRHLCVIQMHLPVSAQQ